MKQNSLTWFIAFAALFLLFGCSDQNTAESQNKDIENPEVGSQLIQGAEIKKLSAQEESPKPPALDEADPERKDPAMDEHVEPPSSEKNEVANSTTSTNAFSSVDAGNPIPEIENVNKSSEEVIGDSVSTNLVSTNTVALSVAELAGVLENQRPQTLSTNQIGNSLKDPKPLATDPDYLTVNFNRLASFNYQIPDEFMYLEEGAEMPEKVPTIPDNIKKLNGEKVAVTGFMLPLKVEKGLVTELLLMRDQSMCCFGTVPEINEWISIRTEKEGKGFKPINDQAVTFFGELKVGEIRENGYLVGIYEMEGNKMVGPGNLKEF